MTKTILLSGAQGSGKTTIANELLRQLKLLRFDYGGTEKFAETLYELHDYMLNRMAGLTGEKRIKKDGPLLQFLGTDWGRSRYGDNVWCDILKRKIETKLNPQDTSRHLIIIDDCRFENEFDTFPEALRVRLEAPEKVRKLRCSAWRDNVNHPSETGLDRYAGHESRWWARVLIKLGLLKKPISKFDLTLDTSGDDLTKCVNLIAAQLAKDNWVEKRK